MTDQEKPSIIETRVTETGLLVTTQEDGSHYVWTMVGVAERQPEQAMEAPPPRRPTNPNDIHGRLDWIEYQIDQHDQQLYVQNDAILMLEKITENIWAKVGRNHREVKRMLSGVRKRIWILEPGEKFPPLTHYPHLTLAGVVRSAITGITEEVKPMDTQFFNHILSEEEIRQQLAPKTT